MLTDETWLLEAATAPKDPLTWSGFKLSWYELPLEKTTQKVCNKCQTHNKFLNMKIVRYSVL